MVWIRAFAPIVFAAGAALAALPALAQSTPPPEAKAKREKVDARAMVPGPQASDAPSDARPASGLTRDQRKEATLQARQEGTLQPAGDTAEPREAKPASLASGSGAARPAVAEAAPAARADPTAAAAASPGAQASPAPTIATGAPAASTTKKGTRKKSRGAGGPTPA